MRQRTDDRARLIWVNRRAGRIGDAAASARGCHAGRWTMTDRIEAWQCVGCGRIEAPQTCIGVCRDRRIQLVDADAHTAALAALQSAMAQTQRLEALVRQLALTTPRDDAWERTYRALQQQARQLLEVHADAEQVS
jgi:hypothetical protein